MNGPCLASCLVHSSTAVRFTRPSAAVLKTTFRDCLRATSRHPQTKITRCSQILLTQSQRRWKLLENSKSCLNSSVQRRIIHIKCRPSSSASIREICLATQESRVLTSTACVKVENRQAVHLAQAARHFVKTTAQTSSSAKTGTSLS